MDLWFRRVLVVGGGFAGLRSARDLKSQFLVTVVDAKEFFEYTPGILRVYVAPKHFDAITFTLRPVVEGRMRCKFIWGEVLQITGPERTAAIQPLCQDEFEVIDFDFCIIAVGCNFGPFHRWGESLWFPTIHAKARGAGSWPQFDERYLEGRRRHILAEYAQLNRLNEIHAEVLIVGAGFIGVEWATELHYFFPNLGITIIDHLPNCLGPLPESAIDYCSRYMAKADIKQFYNVKYDPSSNSFWNHVSLPDGAERVYICMGVKASNFFMPPETLSESGPFGGGWILMDSNLAVKNRDGGVWSIDHVGLPRVFAVGDCNYPCIEERGKPPQEWLMPPIPKTVYPGEEEAVIACTNICKVDKLVFECQVRDDHGNNLRLHNAHWPWGAGMWSISLGPHDACFVMGASWVKHSGCTPVWGSLSALQKLLIEVTKVNECAYGSIGRAIWHLVHHTPIHLFGGGPFWGYHA